MAASKKWLQQYDIYDPDLDSILQNFNIKSEEDLKSLKQKDWNAIWNQAFVERIKSIKEQKAKQRLEKKMKKLEKLWRKASGEKITSITDNTKDSSISQLDNTSASKQKTNEALNEAPELKKWLKQKGIWLKDLFEVLVQRGINGPDDFFLILDDTLNEIKREVRVLRAKELKSNDAKKRLENILQKFEEEWRKSEGETKKKKQIFYDEKEEPPMPTQTSKQAAQEELAEKGKHLKEWMRAEGIWQIALYEELINVGITNPENLKTLKKKQFNDICTKVKVDRFSQLKSQTARANADKILIKFEKLYKKQKK
eukprot:853868_1